MQFELFQFIDVDAFIKLINDDGSGDCGDNVDDNKNYTLVHVALIVDTELL